MKPSIAKQHEAIAAAYDVAVTALADRVRRELVAPYCERTGYAFAAGMGTWGFRKANRESVGHWIWENTSEGRRKLGARLYDALCLTVYNGQDLGSVVADYKPTTYREA